MITIVDYGVGNVRAFLNAYRRLNIEAATARDVRGLAGATRIILPGVGNFDQAMHLLEESGMREELGDLVLNRRMPVLGVCVGMQMLGRSSDEGILPGLGWMAGTVHSFRSLPFAEALPLPHMGWNDVRPTSGSPLFREMETDLRFYFLHSYYFSCDRPADSAAVAQYGAEFTCAVHAGNIHGVQFHPEKSHHWGTRLLQNFAAL